MSHSTKVINSKTAFLEQSIRDGFTSEDVRMWQALCRHCETKVGKSHEYMFTILDIAKHNNVGALDIVKTGRMCSEQKHINERFMECLLRAVMSDDEEEKKVLDLTADEELSESGSYEEEEKDFYKDLTSAEAYEVDGYPNVVDDEAGCDDDTDDKVPVRGSVKRKLKQTVNDDDFCKETPHYAAVYNETDWLGIQEFRKYWNTSWNNQDTPG